MSSEAASNFSLVSLNAKLQPVLSNSLSDEELMARFQLHAEEAVFNELARRYTPRAYRIALGMLCCPSAAEDAVQECFLRVIRSRGEYRCGATFTHWIFTILRNICRDEHRHDASHPTDPGFGWASREPGPDPHKSLEVSEAAGRAAEALARLPAADREALTLRIHGNLDFAAIAQLCGLPTDVVKKRVYRALERLRRELEPDQ